MHVTCKNTDWFLLSPRSVRNGIRTMTSYKGVEIGKTYPVYSIIVYEEGIRYLLFDEFSMPNWYPAELFDIVSSSIPAGWFFRFFGTESALTAIWGYDELVNSESHYDDLCQQDSTAVQLFYRRKREVDALH